MPQAVDVAIVGGGVIGCSIAYELTKRGVKSTVFERDRCGAGASGATTGIIGPLFHGGVPDNKDKFALGLRSLDMFPPLAVELREAGVDPELQLTGLLKPALDEQQAGSFKDKLPWQSEHGLGVRWLERDDVIEMAPGLNPSVMGGVYSPKEGCIRGQAYVDALVHAASRGGATFLEDAEVVSLEADGRRITGIRTATESYRAGHTVIAAGAWTGIRDRWIPDEIPVSPSKGESILLRRAGFLPVCAVQNIMPQVDGSILVGATGEPGSFDQTVTADGIGRMFASAAATFPELRYAEFVGARAGIRPVSRDDMPIMGPVPGWSGLSVATGHGGAGVMLAPGSGELMADYIDTGQAGPLQPFSLSRFSPSG